MTGRSASLTGSQLETGLLEDDDTPTSGSASTRLLDRLTKLYTIRDEVTKMMNSDTARPSDDRPLQNLLM